MSLPSPSSRRSPGAGTVTDVAIVPLVRVTERPVPISLSQGANVGHMHTTALSSESLCNTCQKRLTSSARAVLSQIELRNIQRASVHSLHPRQVTELREGLRTAETHIQNLRDIISGLEEYTGQTRTILSPIRWLPNEMLSLIFMRVCSATARDAKGAKKTMFIVSGMYAPMVIATICRRWRDVAVGTPHLWTFVSAPLPTDKRKNAPPNPHEKELIPLYLRRSGIMPITLDVATRNEALVRQLCEAAPRWTEVLFNFPPQCLEAMYRSLADVEMNQLTTLTFVDLQDRDAAADTCLAPVFTKVPKLHMLCLGGPVSDPALHPLPFDRISSLVLSWMSDPLGTLRTIALCTSAYHLSVSDVFMNLPPEQAVGYPEVETPAPFVSFRLSKQTEACITQILPYLRAPAMFALKLALWDGAKIQPLHRSVTELPVFPLETMVQFVRNSGATLRRLEITGVRVTEEGLIDLLEAAEVLAELFVQHPKKEARLRKAAAALPPAMGLRFIGRMTLGPEVSGQRPLVPMLRNISLHWHGCSRGLRRMDVLRMVASRTVPEASNVAPTVNPPPKLLRSVALRGMEPDVQLAPSTLGVTMKDPSEWDMRTDDWGVLRESMDHGELIAIGEVTRSLSQVPKFKMMWDDVAVNGP